MDSWILRRTEEPFDLLHIVYYFHRWKVQQVFYDLNGCVFSNSQNDSLDLIWRLVELQQVRL